MNDPTVELVGDFTPEESQYLWDTFDRCRIELLARSRRTPDLALLRWTSAPAAHTSRSKRVGRARVSDPSRIPLAAYYVLERRARDFALTRIDTRDQLAAKYPGHFEPTMMPVSARPRGCLPGLFGSGRSSGRT